MSGPILLILRFLFVAALLAFLGGMLYLLWRDLTRQRERQTGMQPAPLILIPADAPPRPFSAATILIGRDPSCDLCLDDATVSAQHARLSYHHNQWWLEDLRSRNGTLLHDEPITTPTVITRGDVIRCGGVELRIGDTA
jgi:pSer/pThr/pTyr-binding forkhead associated (FHA) protein